MLATILALLIGVVTANAQGSPMRIPAELAKPDVAAKPVRACGFANARSKFDETLQEDVIEVRDVTAVSEKQLRCAALTSLDTHYYVVFSKTVEQAYQPLYWR